MGLSRTQIIDAAYTLLREQGLIGLSMRRLAHELEVQPGALYYHVSNKQELLAEVATRILENGPRAISTTSTRQAAHDLRDALLRVRDAAEVVSFAHAFRPAQLAPLAGLRRLFADRFPPRRAEWATRTLVHYVLGFVAEEQNRAELVHARALEGEAADEAESNEAFIFGLDVLEAGFATISTTDAETDGGPAPG